MFECLTEQARQVVEEARNLTASDDANGTGTAHLLAGFFHEEESGLSALLSSCGVTLPEILPWLKLHRGGGDGSSRQMIPTTSGFKRSVDMALREALALGHNYIGPEHVLLGLLDRCNDDSPCDARQFLDEVGVETARIRIAVLQKLDAEQVTEGKLGGLILQLARSIDSLSLLIDEADISNSETRAAILREILKLMHVKRELQSKS